MKRRTLMVLTLVLMALILSARSSKGKTTQQAIQEGTYDWDSARKSSVEDLERVLDTIMVGSPSDYATARTEWLPRIRPESQGAMFPSNYTPPKNCSVTVSYRGYSSQEHNSEETEYIYYVVRVLNNETLASIDYDVVVELERGNDGYIIGSYTQTRVVQ